MSKNTLGSLISSKVAKAGGIGAVANVGMKGFVATKSFNRARREGSSLPSATIQGASTAFLADIVGGGNLLAMKGLKAAPVAATKAFYTMDQQRRNMGRAGTNIPFQNANFVDTQQAYTMRQAGLKAAQQSQFNTQQAMLGNEAQYIG